MKLTLKDAKKIMERMGGALDLSGTQITSLPDNLTVGGSLDLSRTQITSLPDNLTVGGWLDLSGTQITSLPDNLTVGGSLDLRWTQIMSLPDNLTVGGSLDLRWTQIMSLPDNLTVGGWLDLSGTQITSLPDNLTVGGWLDLSGTQITSLPDNLTVGGWLDLSGTQIERSIEIRKVKWLIDGTIKKQYIYADGVLFHRGKYKHKIGEYTVYTGKIQNQMLVTDGTFWSHCKTAKEGIADILFKRAKDRGADQYKNLDLDKEYTVDELKTMYRIITGACRQGTESFVNSIRYLKSGYTIREAIEITKGQYNSGAFASFFED